MTALEVIGGLGLTGIGAAILRLAQIYVEKRGSAASPSKDAADLVTAAALFQEAMNAAAQGVVGDLVANQTRLEAEIDNLKRDHAAELTTLRDQHADCERRVADLRGELAHVKRATGIKTPPPTRQGRTPK
jgi:hypothetical protein